MRSDELKLYREGMNSKTRTNFQSAKDRAKSGFGIPHQDYRDRIPYVPLAPFFAG